MIKRKNFIIDGIEQSPVAASRGHGDTKSLVDHGNNFGALRLLFAYAVILSHSPEMLDGNRLREPFIALGIHNSLGGFSVEGFFIISGYLIASSYLSKPSLSTFLASRILRIYPAFCLAYLICILVVGPISGGALDALGLKGLMLATAKMVILKSPLVPGAFSTLPIPALDGSMWTIIYEFRCYLIVGLLGQLGWLGQRWIVLGITFAFYAAGFMTLVSGAYPLPSGAIRKIVDTLIGDPTLFFSLTAIFMSGVSLRLFRDILPFKTVPLVASAALCIASASFYFSDLIFGTFGSYCVLWLAVGLKSRILRSINNSYDYSYGMYLYAWPIASLVILYFQSVGWQLSPMALTAITVILSTAAGAASWHLVERPIRQLKSRLRISPLRLAC